jgi:hypothetical protein
VRLNDRRNDRDSDTSLRESEQVMRHAAFEHDRGLQFRETADCIHTDLPTNPLTRIQADARSPSASGLASWAGIPRQDGKVWQRDPRLPEQARDRAMIRRPREVKALGERAAHPAQLRSLQRCFHAFGDDPNPQVTRDRDQPLHNGEARILRSHGKHPVRTAGGSGQAASLATFGFQFQGRS